MNKLQTFCLCFILTLVTFSCKNTQKTQTKSNHYNPDLAELAERMTGSFNSYQQSVEDTSYLNITLEARRIWEDRKDGYWMYVEQAAARAKYRPYRQRIYRVSASKGGGFKSEVYKIPDAKRFIGAYKQKALLDILTPDSLELREGCAIIIEKKGEVFVGESKGKNCSSSLYDATYATSKASIYKDRLESWDRGFNDDDEHIWGPDTGPYIFNKMKKIELKYPESKTRKCSGYLPR